MLYLDFDYSEDGHGCGNFEAMASIQPTHVAAVEAEIKQVLDWAHAAFPGMQAALDEGGEWDFDLQAQPETVAGQPRQTLTLSLTGTAQFCEAFRGWFLQR
jgi:hypothetical protein